MADRTNNPGTSGNTGTDRSQTDRQNPDLNEEGGMSGSNPDRGSESDRSRSGNTGDSNRESNVTGDEKSREGGQSGKSDKSGSDNLGASSNR